MRAGGKALRARMRLIAIAAAGIAAVTLGALAAVNMGGKSADKSADKHTATTAKASATPTATATHLTLTPATGRKLVPLKPGSVKNGIGVGFNASGLGAQSAAISYWQDLDILDTSIARRQWTQITSKDSPDTVDRQVSAVMKTREGSGLPPVGGTPAGLSFTTVVDAVIARSLDDTGTVVDVWMVYDRYATLPADKSDDNAPLKNQLVDLTLKWEDGDWKVTEEPKYKHKFRPVPFEADSTYALAVGWREVAP